MRIDECVIAASQEEQEELKETFCCSRIYFLLIKLKSLLRDGDEHEAASKFLSFTRTLDGDQILMRKLKKKSIYGVVKLFLRFFHKFFDQISTFF